MHITKEILYRRKETELTAQYFINLSIIKKEPLYKKYALNILVRRNFYLD